jgi:MFS family permease
MLNHYRKNLRAAVGSSPGPYGYALATWSTGAVITNARGIPDTLAALAFMAGAVLGFAFVGVLAFGGLTKHFDRERGQALLWGSFHFFSVGLAIGTAALVAYYVQSFIACPWRPSCRRLSTFSS